MISGERLQLNNNLALNFANNKLSILKNQYFNTKVKSEDIRFELSSKEIKLLKEEAQKFYKDIIFKKLNTVEDNKKIDIKNKIIAFNKICNIVMRKQVYHKLKFDQFSSCLTIFEDLGLTIDEQEQFIISTIFINLHTHRGINVKGVLKFIIVVLLALLKIFFQSLMYGLGVLCTCGFIGLSFYVSIICVMFFCIIFVLLNIKPNIKEISTYFNAGDSLDSYTNSFKNIMKSLNLQASDIGDCCNIINLCSDNKLLHEKFYDSIMNFLKFYGKTNINILNSSDNIQKNNEIIKDIINVINKGSSDQFEFIYNNKRINFSYEEVENESEKIITFNQNISLALYDPINLISLNYNDNDNDSYWVILKQPESYNNVTLNNNKYFYGFYKINNIRTTVQEFIANLHNKHPLTCQDITVNDIFSVEDFLKLCI